MSLRYFSLLGTLLLSVFLCTGCQSGTEVTAAPEELPVTEMPLEIPALFQPDEHFIDPSDFAQGWERFEAPSGKLSFLYPASWQVDAGEWNISHTVFVGTAEDAAHPVDLLLTVHAIGNMSMEEALEDQFNQIRINPLTSRIINTKTKFLDPGSGSGRTIVAYRTTQDADQSFLHLIIPRQSTILIIETPSIDSYVAYPVRVLLESISFRD